MQGALGLHSCIFLMLAQVLLLARSRPGLAEFGICASLCQGVGKGWDIQEVAQSLTSAWPRCIPHTLFCRQSGLHSLMHGSHQGYTTVAAKVSAPASYQHG